MFDLLTRAALRVYIPRVEPSATPTPVGPTDPAHAHTSACWWDHLKPGWVCPSATEAATEAAARAATEPA